MNRFPTNLTMSIALCLVIAMIAGCDQGESGDGEATTKTAAKLPDGVLLAAAPEAPVQPVSVLKETAKPGDSVTVKVVIGGRAEPIVSKRAVMSVVDVRQSNRCYLEDDHCPTPWDYCCDSADIPPHQATVQIVDAQGKPLALDLTTAGLKPGQVLLVQGVVGPRSDSGTLIINATGLFIAAEDPAAA